jgi:hypothetical protein
VDVSRALKALAGVLAAAFLVTRFGLLWRFPPFVDEASYAWWAWQIFDDHGLLFVSLANGKEPLLPWLGAAFMWGGLEPLTAVRLVSILSAVATLTCTTLIARELGGRAAAWTAAAMCVVLPFFAVHDTLGIYDPLAAAATAAALLFQIRLARNPSAVTTLALGLVLGAGLLTKQSTYMSFVLMPLGLLLLERRRDAASIFAWAARLAVAAGIAVAMYSVLLLSEHYHDLARVRDVIYPTHSVGEALSSPGLWIERNWPSHREALGVYLTPPLIVLLTIGTGLALRRIPRLAFVVLAWGIAPIAAAVLIADNAYPRYILTAIPPLVALAAYGASAVAEQIRRAVPGRAGLAVTTALAAIALVPALLFDARVLVNPATATYPSLDDEQFATGWAAGGPWRPLVRDLRRLQGDEPASILLREHGSEALRLLLRHDPSLKVVREADGTTLYGVANDVPLEDPAGPVTWRALSTYPRPRGGQSLTLFQRGVAVDRVFATSPDELRQQLALPDAEFDAFLARHPNVREWYAAWYEARS